jgi:hypothetical protein
LRLQLRLDKRANEFGACFHAATVGHGRVWRQRTTTASPAIRRPNISDAKIFFDLPMFLAVVFPNVPASGGCSSFVPREKSWFFLPARGRGVAEGPAQCEIRSPRDPTITDTASAVPFTSLQLPTSTAQNTDECCGWRPPPRDAASS